MQKNHLVSVTLPAHNDSQKLFIQASSLFGKCFKYLIDGVYQESCRTNALSPHHGQQVSSASGTWKQTASPAAKCYIYMVTSLLLFLPRLVNRSFFI